MNSYIYDPLLLALLNHSIFVVRATIELMNSDLHKFPSHYRFLSVAAENQRFSLVGDLIQQYPQHIQSELFEYDRNGYLLIPFHRAVLTIKQFQNDQVKNDNDSDSGITHIDYDFQNPDIQSFIQCDPLLLVASTQSSQTICHLTVQLPVELSTRLAGLIEAFINTL